MYTLKTAVSADLSRSTSEMYLEKWEPWYLRWLTFLPSRASIYGQLAEEVAKKNGLQRDGKLSLSMLYGRRSNLKNRMERAKREKEELNQSISEAREKLQTALRLRWPEIEFPYAEGYVALISKHLPQILEFLTSQPDYAVVTAGLDREEELEEQIIVFRREAAQLDKILRLRKLARLTVLFDQFATEQQKREYRRLLACEMLSL